MDQDTCEAIATCNQSLQPSAFQREMLNMVIKFSGNNAFNSESTYQHEALCWWLNDLDSIPQSNDVRGTLIQRHILAALYYSTVG